MHSGQITSRSRPQVGWIPALVSFCQRRQSVVIPLVIALGSRLIVLLAADLLLAFGLHAQFNARPFTGPLSVWNRKDSIWYLTIAQFGYNYSPHGQSRANFFPLFPGLVSVFGHIAAFLRLPSPYLLTGIAISWITFAAACVALYQLTLRRFGRSVAISAIALLCAFPFSLYYGAAYTESIYLALAAGAFLALDHERWWLASALAGVASASRPPGLLIGVCVALAYALDWLRTRHALRLDVLSLALTPVGTLAYMLYCYARWGDPLAYIKTSRAGWHGGRLQTGGLRYVAHALLHPLRMLGTRDPGHVLALFAILMMLGFLALTYYVWRLLGPVYAFFSLASILAPILNFSDANSLGRYLSVIFPIFIVAAYLLRNHPRVRIALYAVGGVLLILFATYFIAGYGLS